MFKNASHWGHNLIVAVETTNVLLLPENSIFDLKMMLKLKNSKPYFSNPIKHGNLRLAPNVKLLS